MQNFSIPQASRRGFLTALGAIGAASALAASLSACGGGRGGTSTQTSAGTPAGGGAANETGTITAAISYQLGTNGYDPLTTTAALTQAVNWHTLEGLTELHPATRKCYAALAPELPKTATGKIQRFKLRGV